MRPVCLIIMDGWGVNEAFDGNATAIAATPKLDALKASYPTTSLIPSGMSVGLPEGQMGNSEVGHLTIGAGRVVYQELSRISRAIDDGSFFANTLLTATLGAIKESGGALHLMGLVSDGGVHSHLDHLTALIKAAAKEGLTRVFVHAFLDGRDTPPKSGLGYIKDLEAAIKEIGVGRIATVSGRYYAMDRDKRWDRVEKAYLAITARGGLRAATATDAVTESYERGENDEFVLPTMIGPEGEGALSTGDSVIFFNFRADRAREIASVFTKESFDGFDRSPRPELKSFVCMTEYDKALQLPLLFHKDMPRRILAEVLSERGIRQFRITETEKYAHVTFFFNGGREEPFPGEERELIDSVRDVPTYDLAPRMRAIEIARGAEEKIKEGGFGFVMLNFANGDMVGHTGNLKAAVESCEAVDEAVGIVASAAREKGYAVLITADHGNAEEMINERDEAVTAHSIRPVPFILVDDKMAGVKLRDDGGLKDIAPTILKIMEIEKPEEMDGASLI